MTTTITTPSGTYDIEFWYSLNDGVLSLSADEYVNGVPEDCPQGWWQVKNEVDVARVLVEELGATEAQAAEVAPCIWAEGYDDAMREY